MSRILIVDDSQTIRTLIVHQLETAGYTVMTAFNGLDAKQILEVFVPDMIICDVEMPEMNGYELLNYIRDTTTFSNIPFIFLTSLAQRNQQRYGMGLGADDYIVKPCSQSELITAIETRLQRKANLDEKSYSKQGEHILGLSRVLAHELRTPVAGMNQSIGILEKKIDSLKDEQVREMLNTIRDSGNRLKRTIEQNILHHKIQSEQINHSYVENFGKDALPDEMIANAITQVTQYKADSKLERKIIHTKTHDHTAMSFGISQLLERALFETILNAYTFTGGDGMVHIQTHTSSHQIIIEISDSGQGIPAPELAMITQALYQVQREQNEQQGLGLGLVIAKAILTIHGGELCIESSKSGTNVTMVLPRA